MALSGVLMDCTFIMNKETLVKMEGSPQSFAIAKDEPVKIYGII